MVGRSQHDGNFSPDGHWLVYFPDETGQPEVYVVPFPGPGGKDQIHIAHRLAMPPLLWSVALFRP